MIVKAFFLFLVLWSHSLLSQEKLTSTKGIEKASVVVEAPLEPIAMANLEGEPSAYVHGCVNVISGQYCESETDLVATHGVTPLKVERTFFGNTIHSGALAAGWTISHFSKIKSNSFSHMLSSDVKRSTDFIIWEDHGGVLPFFDIGSEAIIPRAFFAKGVTNTAAGAISGQTNLNNLKVQLGLSAKTLIYPTGGWKVFTKDLDTKHQSRLLHDVKPNGNRFACSYCSHPYLRTVQLLNSQLKPRATLTFDPISRKQNEKNGTREITASNGQWVRYHFDKWKHQLLLSTVERSAAPSVAYGYYHIPKELGDYKLIFKKTQPEKRILEMEYYEEKTHHNIAGHEIYINDYKDPRLYRVRQLLAPAGTDANRVPIYEFIYDLNLDKKKKEVLNGICTVFNAARYKTLYEFDTNQRLVRVDKCHADGSLYTRESIYWDEWRCQARTLEEANKGMVFARQYVYDKAGNILTDRLYGNLSGHNPVLPQLSNLQGTENGCECYVKDCAYSQDGFNLLIEENDGFNKVTYQYYPNSNRLANKFVWDGSSIYRRWFYVYDHDGALLLEVEDDGTSQDKDNLTGISERHLTYYTQNTAEPYGFPIVIEKKCWDLETNQELTVHKVVNAYTPEGRIATQQHHDNRGALQYTLAWEYDQMGKVTKETDALGRAISRKYDANGNCIFMQGPDLAVCKNFTYDFMNRLIREEEVHSDGISRFTSHRYTPWGVKSDMTDTYGNTTYYGHDAFGRIIATRYPHVMNEEGQAACATIRKSYDAMGYVAQEIDGRGGETNRIYTLRGQLAFVRYADGTEEQNSYQLNGVLKESKARNGTVTRYTNDLQGRPTKMDTYAANGEWLATTSATYNAFHKLTETDAMGVTTIYSYCPDGKLKSKRKAESFIEYTYDMLGRPSQTIEHFGSDSKAIIITTKEYDLLDRVLKETVEDSSGDIISQVSYGYDNAGNICQLISHDSVTSTTYDSHGVPRLIVDGEGNKTITTCRYDYRNEMGQNVPYKEVTDSLGNITIIIQDALGRVVNTYRKNPFGTITQQQEVAYDLNGNRCILTDTIFSTDDNEGKKIISSLSYDICNRLTSFYEALDTPQQKQTHIVYNSYGEKQDLCKADGTKISHTYDAWGRLSALKSSDGTISYAYHYDLNSNPVQVADLIQGNTTRKHYDANNRLIKEVLGNGLCIEYALDGLGRPLKVTLPDNSGIVYQYRASLLESIGRIDDQGKLLYAHKYTRYDPSGHLLDAQMIGQAGELHYQYNKLGKEVSITSKQWGEKIKYDSCGNLIEKLVQDNTGMMASTYDFDDLYQVIGEKGAATHTYRYDSHYNRRSKDGKQHVYNDLHQLTHDGVWSYKYDANGNLISKSSDRGACYYTYDALDRLIAFENERQKATYIYDDTNRRLTKTVNSQTMNYLYQGQNEIGACDTLGNIVELRLLGTGKGAEIGAAVAIEIDKKVFVPIHDHAGNLSCLIEAETGTAVANYSYSAYGEELFEQALIPWRFASKRVDEESGLVYFGRRYYEPTTARWITPDPIGRDGGPNLYAYVLNNPLTHFDLYGLFDIVEGLLSLVGVMFNSIKTALSYAGEAVEFFGRHLLPVPYVKDLVEYGGHCLAGKNPSEWSKDHSQVYRHDGYGNPDPHMRLVVYNGICTPFRDFKAECRDISEENGGVTVYGVYNSTNGFILDLLEVLCQKVGIPTHAQAVAQRETARIASDMGDHGTLYAHAHSQGAETVHNLSPNLKKMTHVSAYGPARVLNSSEFTEVRNYLSPLDYVTPLADPVGYFTGLVRGEIQFIPPSGNPFRNHEFKNDAYSNMRAINGRVFKKMFGGVETVH